MPRQRYKVFQNTEHYPYFITCTTVQWLPLFTRAEVCQILIDVWLYQRQHKQLKIYAWVILDNHIHAILAAPDLAKVVQQWKSYTSRKVLEYFTLKQQNYLLDELRFLKGTLARGQEDRERTTHRVWQTGYHPQIIDEEHLWQQKADYITHNPVKRGLVVAPEDWRFSWAHEWRKGARPVMQVDPWFPQNPKE